MNAHQFYKKIKNHRYGFSLGIYLTAAIATGVACVWFMKVFEFVYERQLDLASIGFWCWLTTPLLFILAIELIRRVAPCADGAGIPQTIFAAQKFTGSGFGRLSSLVSFRTMTVKIVALLIGLWAGASTGREGPTVHVAACLFFGICWALHRLFKLSFDARSAVIAGGAAGLAAAFNTPLAGVTFAIEELSTDYFSNIKDMVLIAIIVAGLAAKSLTGDYIYFGKLDEPASVSVWLILIVGVLAGGSGAFFSSLLIEGRRRVIAIQGWKRYLCVAVLAWAVLFIAIGSGMKGISGPGNFAAQDFIHENIQNTPVFFAIFKMAATLFTYWSGIAGGIFAPSLSIGSAIGAWVASCQHGPIGACAVIGMAAFLSGTIQAHVTSFVIIFEMTNQHQMLLPVMLASLIGYMTARLFKAKHLYQTLAANYEKMFKIEAAASVPHSK